MFNMGDAAVSGHAGGSNCAFDDLTHLHLDLLSKISQEGHEERTGSYNWQESRVSLPTL